MTAEFDFDNTDDVSAETIAAITAEMSPSPVRQVTDEERQQHEAWLAASRERDFARQREYEQERFALAEAERLESEQRAGAARGERNRQLQEQMREKSERTFRDRHLRICTPMHSSNGSLGTWRYDHRHKPMRANG